MKRFHILTAALLTLAVFHHGYNQTRRGAARQEGVSRRDVIGSRAGQQITKAPKGEALVKKLPEGVEGVELKDGVVKIMPGYEFEKKDGKVAVMRVAGGGPGGRLGVSGTFSCVCKEGAGGCSAMVVDNQIYCAPGGEPACPDKCVLSIVIKAARTAIMRY